MAKKKAHEDEDEIAAQPGSEATSANENPSSADPESNSPLMEEIQTFMAMRDELAQKLAVEIEATERRLEELRKTAASLFPQASESTDDKKAKKAKPKSAKESAQTDSSE